MSDYIKRQDVLDIIDKEMMRTITFAENETQANIEDDVRLLPPLNETEIIRKAFERVVQRAEEESLGGIAWESWLPLKTVIKIVKEECGISE